MAKSKSTDTYISYNFQALLRVPYTKHKRGLSTQPVKHMPPIYKTRNNKHVFNALRYKPYQARDHNTDIWPLTQINIRGQLRRKYYVRIAWNNGRMERTQHHSPSPNRVPSVGRCNKRSWLSLSGINFNMEMGRYQVIACIVISLSLHSQSFIHYKDLFAKPPDKGKEAGMIFN